MSIHEVKPYCIGLTGNIGSGKSTVIRLFKRMGAAIIIADEIAREVTQSGQPALQNIRSHFGENVIDENGLLNRTALRHIIFANQEERRWLEALLHPLIRQRMQNTITRLGKVPYCIIEIPLLLNRENYPYVQRILLVSADRDTQLHRVMQRDHCSKEHAMTILATQPDEQNRMQLADDILVNNESPEVLELQVEKLHKSYLRLARKWDLSH